LSWLNRGRRPAGHSDCSLGRCPPFPGVVTGRHRRKWRVYRIFYVEVPTFSRTCHRFASENISIGGAHLSSSCHRLGSSIGKMFRMFATRDAHLSQKLSQVVAVALKEEKYFRCRKFHLFQKLFRPWVVTEESKFTSGAECFLRKVPTVSRSCRRLSSSNRRVYKIFVIGLGCPPFSGIAADWVGIGESKGVKTEC
jgi:hypothetical protein